MSPFEGDELTSDDEYDPEGALCASESESGPCDSVSAAPQISVSSGRRTINIWLSSTPEIELIKKIILDVFGSGTAWMNGELDTIGHLCTALAGVVRTPDDLECFASNLHPHSALLHWSEQDDTSADYFFDIEDDTDQHAESPTTLARLAGNDGREGALAALVEIGQTASCVDIIERAFAHPPEMVIDFAKREVEAEETTASAEGGRTCCFCRTAPACIGNAGCASGVHVCLCARCAIGFVLRNETGQRREATCPQCRSSITKLLRVIVC